jgi:phage shock protein E
MGFLDLLGFGQKSTASLADFVSRQAVVIDVRTVGEFQSAHIKGAKNIPLDSVFSKVETIKKMNKPVIVCCRSGMRSGQAKSILEKSGIEVINGGGWESLNQQLSKL